MHRYLPAFFLTYGHEIAYENVNDRPRLRGASKYTNLGRALIGLYDLVGVSWLRKRTLIPPVVGSCLGVPYGERMAPSGKASLAPKRARQVKGGEFDMHLANLVHWWQTTPTTELVWIAIGFIAQLLFSMRFIVQWIATEKARASIIPETFWYFSFFGGDPAARLRLLPRGPGVHPRPGGRPRDLFAQHLFHLARQEGAEPGQGRLTGWPSLRTWASRMVWRGDRA